MRTKIGLILTVQTLMVVLLAVLVRAGLMPLGVRGEWEWLRVKAAPPLAGLALAGLAVAAYCGFAALGWRALAPAPARRAPVPAPVREGFWLAGLLGAAIAIQALIPLGAADEYDLTKWAYVNYFPGSAGYYRIARRQATSDPWRFLAEYPVWIRSQDSLHIGTHPPGLILAQCLLLRLMEQNPGVTGFLNDHMPYSTAGGFRQLEIMDRQPIPRADRAALYLTGVLTLLACAGTVVPLYLLARGELPAPMAWGTAVLWPLAPAANLFQPVADTAYPLLSTTALALAAWAARRASTPGGSRFAGSLPAVLSGLVLAFGMNFTLAFLPVGLIVALVLAFAPPLHPRRKVGLILATGVGFLTLTLIGWVLTGANPLTVWTWNLRNHARFYDEYPRTYLAWLLANPVELAIALGLPAAAWCALGLAGNPRSVPRVAWATLAVLIVLNLSGRNMGEVARLWMLFLPGLLTFAGAGLSWRGAGARSLAYTAALIGLQTLMLQTMIQVVYPV